MLKSTAALAGLMGLLVMAPAVSAGAEDTSERFTFTLAGEAWEDVRGAHRLDLVIHEWSPDARRDEVAEALQADGPGALMNVLRTAPVIGTIDWPGNLTYSVRYARRLSREDGGPDIVFIVDRRAWTWWDANLTTLDGDEPFTVFQVRVNRDGSGEGKASVAAPITADAESGVALAAFDTQPALMTDVRHEHRMAPSGTT